MMVLQKTVRRCVFAVLAASPPAAHAEPPLPPIVPHANMPGRYVCEKKYHLYERGRTYFCAVDPKLWPKRVGYVVLDSKAADQPLVDEAFVQARKLTGAEIVPDSKPDLVIVVQHERLDASGLKTLAAKVGMTLQADEIAYVTHRTDTTVGPDQFFEGQWRWVQRGSRRYLLARIDTRVGPRYAKDATPDKIRENTKTYLRDYVLAYFGIQEPVNEITDMCSLDDEAKALAADKTHVDPTVLPDRTDGLACGSSNQVLLRHAGETFCARPPDRWPRTITYATIGAAAAAHVDDVAAAVAHVERLTGRKLVVGAKPSVVLALVDHPLDAAEVDATLSQAHVAQPAAGAGSLGAAFLPAARSNLKALLEKAAASSKTKDADRSPIAYMRSQACFAIELEEAIPTNRPAADVRKDIDDAFLQVFQIEPPTKAQPVGAN